MLHVVGEHDDVKVMSIARDVARILHGMKGCKSRVVESSVYFPAK
jgi:hypothetical protein